MKNSDATLKRLLASFMLPALDSSDCRFLTEEDCKRIKGTFSHTTKGKARTVTSKEKIEAFIAHLDHYCEGKKALLNQPQKIDVREIREDVLKDCMHVLKVLKKVKRGKMTLWYDDTIDHFGAGSGAGKDLGGDFLDAILAKAWDAVGPLEKFIKVLENYHRAEVKRVGRKKADSDHFVRIIRDIYIEHIGKPTSHEAGPFFALIQIIFEIFGLPCADPSRAIKEALKKAE